MNYGTTCDARHQTSWNQDPTRTFLNGRHAVLTESASVSHRPPDGATKPRCTKSLDQDTCLRLLTRCRSVLHIGLRCRKTCIYTTEQPVFFSLSQFFLRLNTGPNLLVSLHINRNSSVVKILFRLLRDSKRM